HAERQSFREDIERQRDRAAIALAAPDREVPDAAEQEAQEEIVKDLGLRHPADRRADAERDARRILPARVVRDEDVRAGSRNVLGTIDLDPHERERDETDQRGEPAPQPQIADRRGRRLREEPLDHVVVMIASTFSRACPTERPSVWMTIASSAAFIGATARSLSS